MLPDQPERCKAPRPVPSFVRRIPDTHTLPGTGKFEQLCSDLLERCKIPVQSALRDAKLDIKDVDEVSLAKAGERWFVG